MQLENFTIADIPQATELTFLTWGEEMELSNIKLKKLIYEAMVRYYFRNTELSFKLVDEQGMQGFLLAAKLSDKPHYEDWLEKSFRQFSDTEKSIVEGYLKYLHYNGEKVRQTALDANDVLLCLFLSLKRGGGKLLLENIEQKASLQNIPQLHLWADATCDYEYYIRHGYLATNTFVNNILPNLGSQKTWIYSKKM